MFPSSKKLVNRSRKSMIFSNNMKGQSLRNAWGLPRDNQNWQMKKYAAITTHATNIPDQPIGFFSRPPNSAKRITTGTERTPRKKAPNPFIIFALPFQAVLLSSLAASILSSDTDVESYDEAGGAGPRPWPAFSYGHGMIAGE